jgi:hypothetical protein
MPFSSLLMERLNKLEWLLKQFFQVNLIFLSKTEHTQAELLPMNINARRLRK